jgi:hypothetical protein
MVEGDSVKKVIRLFLFKTTVEIIFNNVIPKGIREPGSEFGLTVIATRIDLSIDRSTYLPTYLPMALQPSRTLAAFSVS